MRVVAYRLRAATKTATKVKDDTWRVLAAPVKVLTGLVEEELAALLLELPEPLLL